MDPIKISNKLCAGCRYSFKFTNTTYACDYIGRKPKTAEKRMRILNSDGSMQYKSGYCDKYHPIRAKNSYWFMKNYTGREEGEDGNIKS